MQDESIRSFKQFHSSCKTCFRQGFVHIVIMKFFVVLTSAVQNLFMFEDVTLELVGDVCFAKLENVSVVNSLIFIVHLSIEES